METRLCVLAFGLWALATSGAGEAQGDASRPQSDTTADQLQEIVVTANRREENQQSVPIAITAITADTAAKIGITDAMALGEAVPGLVFNRQSNGSIPFIRGVGNPNSTPGDEPSVAMYVDEVYIPLAGSGISNYNSITSIEVEKGPQGTLFGRNATGGVVQVYTKNPGAVPEFQASVGYANYDTPSGSLYASGALTDTLSANAAIYGSRQYDGWGHDLTTGQPTFGREYDFGGRVKLLWTPNDRASFLLALDTDTTGTAIGLTYSALPGTKTTNLSILGIPIPGASAPSPSNFYDTYGNFPNYSTNYQSGVSLKTTIDLGWSELVNIAAYRHNNDQQRFDYDDGPDSLFNAFLHSDENTATEELRLRSPDGAAIKWIGGFYLFDDRAGYLPINFDALAPPLAPVFGGNALVPGFVASYGKEYSHSYAGFGQVTDEILPKLNLTAGIRYTVDLRTGSTYDTSSVQQALVTPGTNVLPICPATGVTFLGPGICAGGTGRATFSSPSGKVSLDYHFTGDVMGYIAYNRGFKSGVFNVVSILAPQDPPVKPEKLDAYTIGEKAEFLDHRLRVNTEAYYYKFTDIQEQVVVQDTSHAVNAAKATMEGLELEVTALPAAHWSIAGTIGLEKSYFNDYPDGAYFVYDPLTGGNCALGPTNDCGLTVGSPGAPPHYTGTSWNLRGNQLPNAPPFSFSISTRYEVPTASGTYDWNIALNHIGGYFFQPDNGEGQIAPGRPDNDRQQLVNLLNASVGWGSPDGALATRLWGMNLAGQRYQSFQDEEGNASQYSAAAPRTYGVTFTVHFGGARKP